MKRTDNRQNKMIQMKMGATKHFPPSSTPSVNPASEFANPHELPVHGAVFGLLSNVLVATKMAQAAKHHHVGVHNFDRAEAVIEHVRQKAPFLIVIDWDGCEAEAYKMLKALRSDEAFKKIAVIGYVSQVKVDVKREAERAGCDRVYLKAEFMKDLENIVMRYAK